MLLQAVALPQQDKEGDPSAHFLGPEQAPRLQVEFLFQLSNDHTYSQPLLQSI